MKKILLLFAMLNASLQGQVRLVIESIANLTNFPIQVMDSKYKPITTIESKKTYSQEIVHEFLAQNWYELNFYQIRQAGKAPLARFETVFTTRINDPIANFILTLLPIPKLGEYEPFFTIEQNYDFEPIRNEEESWTFRVKIELRDNTDSLIFFKREAEERR